MDALLVPGYQPFMVAGLVMAGLVLIETISLVAGFSLSEFMDQGFDLDSHGGHHADIGEGGPWEDCWDGSMPAGCRSWFSSSPGLPPLRRRAS
jgi:hypothetical protein